MATYTVAHHRHPTTWRDLPGWHQFTAQFRINGAGANNRGVATIDFCDETAPACRRTHGGLMETGPYAYVSFRPIVIAAVPIRNDHDSWQTIDLQPGDRVEAAVFGLTFELIINRWGDYKMELIDGPR